MVEAEEPEVFCLGLAIQDTILTVASIPSAPVKVYASARREVGGGPAATASVTIARLGGRASFAGRLGDDPTGASLRHELAAENVDVTWLRSFEGLQSPGSVILVDGEGERLIVAYADPNLPRDAGWLTPRRLGHAVLCDLSWPEGAMKCLHMARDNGIPSVLDADISRHGHDEVAALIAAADHVVFSRPGLAQFTGAEAIEAGLREAARPGHALIGVTDGADGLFWLDDGRIRNARPPQVDVVDTVGAGDAFHGALALALARRCPLEEAIAFANAVAALKCTKPGGRAGLPTWDALRRFSPPLDLTCIRAPRRGSRDPSEE
ncbi:MULTISPECIES: PfkB family carbohydrate kinase [unclassified Chelatococcus]|uniref:PfkB family carbohydrate kinase n=1 Tax=unclassified Chelatococcus TaxID=2638111 RepID=UPI001BCFEAF9|nr:MULTISPECIES: PfkB family carbohydrate kinase [unclassified Chelatococcus]MBS7700698.1 ribokinase [Chelatococcus sp. YT9]MBX3559282.1 ribokinase [Chelatococcus sp.]